MPVLGHLDQFVFLNLFTNFTWPVFKPIYFSSLPNCVKSVTSLNKFKNMMIKYFTGL